MTPFAEIIQYIISGVTSGSIYAMVGVCWSIVFLVTSILNFSTGEFVMLGGMLTWVFLGAGIGLAPAVILAIAATVAIGIILERLVIRPVRYPSEMTYMVITIASASIIKGIILITCGSETRVIQALIPVKQISILGAIITTQTILVIGVLAVMAIGLSLFFNRTLLGKALRATAINPKGASLVGIRIDILIVFCFGLAGGLGAIAGIVIAPITFTGYNIGLMTGMKGMVAAIVGGWNMTGTVLAGLGLGLIEGLFGGFISPGWKDAIALVVMILFLICRTISFSDGANKV
ncbi:MAG: branched-chain amino acid ABC transporter permease [Deltaproteobacteria bacterium]|nr:branched-chain amino acid ABC transporter permease [Deltaproteobacteria bacterium]